MARTYKVRIITFIHLFLRVEHRICTMNNIRIVPCIIYSILHFVVGLCILPMQLLSAKKGEKHGVGTV